MNCHLTPDEHSRLWNTFRFGNRDAFSTLYELFAADLYRYGYNLIRNKPLVEDCLHELFLHLYENRLRLGATDNIRFYLYRSLRRRLLDTVTRLNKLDSDDQVFNNAEFLVEPYEKELIDEQRLGLQKELLLHELNRLPKRQKEVLYLVYMKGLTYQQAADVMDIAIKSVYNSINVALVTLRAYVTESLQQQGASWKLRSTALGYVVAA